MQHLTYVELFLTDQHLKKIIIINLVLHLVLGDPLHDAFTILK